MSLDEKRASVEKAEIGSVSSSNDDGGKKKLIVPDFGGDSTLPPPPTLTPAEEHALYRKIDIRLMPILAVLYCLSFIDRANIGNAKIEGLTTELHLVGNQYNIALTMYFIPYCLCECPANLVIKKFRPSKWLPGIAIVWGTVMTLMGLVRTYPQLVGVRVCLGVAEAGLFPGVVYYLTLWYPRHRLQYRVGLFFGAATVSGAFSGLLAYAISFMNGVGGKEGWSWIFILEGLATVVAGVVALFVMYDFPVTATFLTPEERAYIIWKKKYDNSLVGEQEHFEWRYVWAAFRDWQIWLHILIYMSIIGPLYGISLFLPSIINGFGFTRAVSQLLTVPPYVFATLTLLVFGHYSDRLKIRWPFIYLGLIMCLIGFTINITSAPRGVKYFGTFFCVAGSYAAFPGIIAWLGNNLSGQYKRGVGMAIQIGIGNFSGAISSNVYRSQDAPHYRIGHGIELMFVGIGLICVPLAVVIYKRINAHRESLPKQDLSVEELRELGDRAPDFRYTI